MIQCPMVGSPNENSVMGATPAWKKNMTWERTSINVVLDALFICYPDPRGFIVAEEKPKNLDDFSFVWRGTLQALEDQGLILELRRPARTMFKYFRLTPRGLEASRKLSVTK